MSANTFLAKLSELSGDRFDPQMVLYNRKTSTLKYPTFPLKHFLCASPMYGANEPGINRKNLDEPRYIRITDIDEFGNLNDEIGATAENIEDKYYLDENDLLFARSGATVGKTYIHRTKAYPCFFAGYMIKFKIDPAKMNPYFVFTYTQLNTYKEWVKAVQRASAQPNINAEEYKNFPIPLPPLNVQNQIIATMDEAYRRKADNEARAQAILDDIDGYLLSALGITTPEIDDKALSKRVFTRRMSEVSGKRFDPSAHLLDQIFSPSLLEKSKYSILPLKYLVSFSKQIISVNDEGLPYIGLENIESHTGLHIQGAEKQSFGTAFKFAKGHILFPKLRPYLNKIYLAEFDGICSTEFHVLEPHENIAGVYLSEFLRCSLILEQTKRLMTGNTLPRLQTDDILNLLVSVPALEKQNEITDHIGSLRAEAKRLRDEAAQQFETAKAEVEMMILGEVS